MNVLWVGGPQHDSIARLHALLTGTGVGVTVREAGDLQLYLDALSCDLVILNDEVGWSGLVPDLIAITRQRGKPVLCTADTAAALEGSRPAPLPFCDAVLEAADMETGTAFAARLDTLLSSFDTPNANPELAARTAVQALLRRLQAQAAEVEQMRQAQVDAAATPTANAWRQAWEQAEQLYAGDLEQILARLQRRP